MTHTDCDISIKSLEDMPEKYSVARLGSYLNLDKPKFLAGHEQVVRISRSMAIPMSQIALMKLEKPVKLTEYVNTICLPSSEWIPIGTKCQIHGTHNEEFNHAIITRMTSKCNHTGMLFSRKKCYNVYRYLFIFCRCFFRRWQFLSMYRTRIAFWRMLEQLVWITGKCNFTKKKQNLINDFECNYF